MNNYYGFFRALKDFYGDSILDEDFYDGVSAEIYSEFVGQMSKEEFEFYLDSALNSGKNILEVACGDGKRVMIKLAELGFCVDGVEISQDMIDKYHLYAQRFPEKVKRRIQIYKEDIFKFSTDKRYDMITIPATTICLLSDDEENLMTLFNNFYDMLNPNGKLVFDYRLGHEGQRAESQLGYWTKKSSDAMFFVLFQEFHNYIANRSVVDFYIEKTSNGVMKRYLTSSSKKIITKGLIDKIFRYTKFKIYKKLESDISKDEKFMMLSLEK